MKTSVAIKVRPYRGTYRGASAVISRRKKIQRIKSVTFSLFKLTAFISLFYLVVAGGYWGYRYVMASPYFDISNITIDGNINLNRDDILSASNIKIGQNIFSVNTGEIYKRLKGHPWIKDTAVKKEMPDRLKIKINEREPAVILKSNELYLIDDEGMVLAKLNGESDMSFPVIVKPMGLEYKVGDRISSEDVFNGINIWSRLQGVKLNLGDSSFKDNITTIEPLSSEKVKINLKDTNSYIVINGEDIDKKFQHLQTVMRFLEDRTNIDNKEAVKNENSTSLKEKKKKEVREINYIDLSFKDKVIVKYENQ
ncbi:MAG: FtsQ-type POTRA domain-containing protein [Nitrospinae bacterium]|nr:FtsQ-type POTRA domain-containing protein [Nitrospinota bacterium]